MKRSASPWLCVVLGAISISTARAQFSSDFQTNIISGVVSNWSGNYVVGSNTVFDSLRIENGGVLSIAGLYFNVGYEASAVNNSVIVSGSGSLSNDSGILYVGHSGSKNTLIITNGAKAASDAGWLGYYSSANNNSVVVTGSGSVWSVGSLGIGEFGSSNSLVISGGGIVAGGSGVVGWDGFTSNNLALVTGNGSVWSNGDLDIGWNGMCNSLVISNGGVVTSRDGNLGVNAGNNSNNTITVVGNGSLWQSSRGVWFNGSADQLTIADGGSVVASNVCMFNVWPSPGNVIHVLGGSLVVTNASMTIPSWGSGTVTISSGTVQAQSIILAQNGAGTEGILTMGDGSLLVQSAMVVGYGGCSTTGTVTITDGTCAITNAAHSAVLEIRSGILTQTGGELLIDTLVITNACGHFIHSGGDLIIGTLILDPALDADGDGMPNGWEQSHGLDPLNPVDANVDSDGDGQSNLAEFLAGTDPTDSASAFRIISIAQEGGDVRVTWQTGIGRTNTLQASAKNSGLYTNSFMDIFTVTNTVGTITNYLDLGAARSAPARFYRVRLVP